MARLDLLTLMAFRRVNREADEIVSSMPQLEAIRKSAPNALYGAFAIHSARWIICQSLYDALRSPGCEACGKFGGYISLLTCTRVCYICFTRNTDFLPLLVPDAARKFGISEDAVRTLPHMRSVPGEYTSHFKSSPSSLSLVDRRAAHCAGVALYGSQERMEQHVAEELRRRQALFDKRTEELQAEGRCQCRRRPHARDPWDARARNPFRFMAVVHAPWLDPASKELPLRFQCNVCEARDVHDVEGGCYIRRNYTDLATY